MSKVNLEAIRKILMASENDDKLQTMPESEFINLPFIEHFQMDSLGFVVFQMKVEKACNVSLIDIPSKEWDRVITIQDFLNLCEKYL